MIMDKVLANDLLEKIDVRQKEILNDVVDLAILKAQLRKYLSEAEGMKDVRPLCESCEAKIKAHFPSIYMDEKGEKH